MEPRRLHRLERVQQVARPVGDVFAFFAHARNLELITPPWLRFEVLTPDPVVMGAGTLIRYRLKLHAVPLPWTSRIEEWEEGRAFVDRQVRGPYRTWLHRHEFIPCRAGTVVRDRVLYALPLGRLGDLAHAAFVRRDLERIFDFRGDAVQRLLGAGTPDARAT
jgi:ligand-binding SRPBCC domain-containing protein